MTFLRIVPVFFLFLSMTTELVSGGEIGNGTDIDADTGFRDRMEYCPTFRKYESPTTARHLATNLLVDLYFYSGYSQEFQLGECALQYPKITISNEFKSFCDVGYTEVKAYFVIDPKTFPRMDKVENCEKVEGVSRMICNDWILLPTHCKVYYRSKDLR